MAMKQYVLTLETEQISWIKKTAKDFNMRNPELIRSLFNYLRESKNAELKKNLLKSKTETELAEATRKYEEWLKKKESLEAQLETATTN